MIGHYLTTAWRNFLKHQTATTISVLGLSLGLACFIAAVGVLTYIRSADRQLPNADRIVMVMQQFTDHVAGVNAPMAAQSSAALALSIRKEFPNVTVAFVAPTTLNVSAEGRTTPINVLSGDSEYFDIIDLPRSQSVAGNPLSAPRSAVLSDDAARHLFGTTDVLGRTVRLQNALDVTVTAVLKPIPQPSHMSGRFAAFRPDGVFISHETEQALYTAVTGKPAPVLSLEQQWFVTFSSATYALLPKGGTLSASEFETRLEGIDRRNGAMDGVDNKFKVAPLTGAWLASLDMNLFRGNRSLSITAILMVLAFAALGVACANYANLAFAQAMLQAKEVGLRKTIGASRSQLLHQALLEAGLQGAVASLIALAMVAAIGSAIQARAELPLLDAVFSQSGFWIFIAAAALSVTGLIALYPAFTLSRVKPALALRANTKGARTNPGARVLLCVQYIATSALIVVLLVVLAQNSSAQRRASTALTDVVLTLGYSYRNGGADYDTWRTELLRSPAIKTVSTTSTPPWAPAFTGLLSLRPVRGGLVNPNLSNVSYDFEKVLNLKLVAGRIFDKSFGDMERYRRGPRSVIVDETLAKHLGFVSAAAAIGQTISQGGRFEGEPPVTIVGVVADKPMRLQPFLNFVGTVYAPIIGPGSNLIVLIDKNSVATGLNAVDTTWRKLNPSEPIDRTFADESFARSYAIYKIIGAVLTTIASITLAIAVMGAFALAMFVANQRAHEIGVRKTLGASAAHIIKMLLKDFSKPVLIANLIGWPLAYVCAQRYLNTFEQRIDISAWPFAIGVVFTLLIAWLAVGGQAWRAARLKPADVLRHE